LPKAKNKSAAKAQYLSIELRRIAGIFLKNRQSRNRPDLKPAINVSRNPA
jgi:hypothetical protein